MQKYLDYLQFILDNGRTKGTRGCWPIRSAFGYQMRFDLTKGFSTCYDQTYAKKDVDSRIVMVYLRE